MILTPMGFRPERWWAAGRLGVWLGMGVSLLLILYFSICPLLQKRGGVSLGLKPAYDKIGMGCLSLEPKGVLLLSLLGKSIRYLGVKSHPQGGDFSLFLDLEGKGEVVRSACGEMLSVGNGYWLKPLKVQSQRLLAELGNGNESVRFELNEEVQESGLAFIEALKNAKLVGQDQLLHKYGGGDSFGGGKQKVGFFDPGGFYVCFVSEGDFLAWEQGRWRALPLEQVSQGVPLARVKALQGKSAEIEAWDSSGVTCGIYQLAPYNTSKIGFKMEALFSAARLRPSAQVSCWLDKQRMILKPGDWLVKTREGWHALRNMEEIEAFLQHRLSGELFIFDSIDGSVLKGHLFDETRTAMQPISLALEQKSYVKTKETPVAKGSAASPHTTKAHALKGGAEKEGL